MATARAVKITTTRATKKVRAMMVRGMRAMSETSPREEGDNGHNNQLSTKVAATMRTVVASNGKQCKMDGSNNHDRWQWQDQDEQQQRQWATAAQWAPEQQNSRDGQSGVMGGNARWIAAVIMMHGGSKIAMNGSSGDGQQRHNGWQNGKAIAMGDGTATAITATMTQKLAAAVATTMTTTAVDAVGRLAITG
jgi:hypothetical protein